MKTITYLFVLLIALSSCERDSITTNDGSLTGQFQVQIDPIRCAMPTTNALNISQSGSLYRLTYDRYGIGLYELNGVEAKQTSPTAYTLLRNGQEIGQYVYEEVRYIGKTGKSWVLLVRHEIGKPNGLDFMGVKR